ncbi:MAG TPA: hypothetical protein VGL57_12170 [Solirubrobacteraceae bacterium]|jgi:cytoskeletal protein RodZ
MAQISRPFQVVLAAFALLVLVWFFALHRPTSTTSSPTLVANSPASTHRSVSSAAARHAAARRAAHTAASDHATHTAATKGNAAHAGQQAGKSAHTRSAAAGQHHVTTSSAAHAATLHAGAASSASHTGTSHAAAKPSASHVAATPRGSQPAQHGSAGAPKTPSTPAMQATVAAELKRGKVVLLLFWNHNSSSDNLVRQQVQDVARKLGHRVVVHTASASQVGSFGSITRDIQVYQTPTLLIVNPKAQVTTVTGYTDAYALEQTIREARG